MEPQPMRKSAGALDLRHSGKIKKRATPARFFAYPFNSLTELLTARTKLDQKQETAVSILGLCPLRCNLRPKRYKN